MIGMPGVLNNLQKDNKRNKLFYLVIEAHGLIDLYTYVHTCLVKVEMK